jgi:hypothetical protein
MFAYCSKRTYLTAVGLTLLGIGADLATGAMMGHVVLVAFVFAAVMGAFLSIDLHAEHLGPETLFRILPALGIPIAGFGLYLVAQLSPLGMGLILVFAGIISFHALGRTMRNTHVEHVDTEDTIRQLHGPTPVEEPKAA